MSKWNKLLRIRTVTFGFHFILLVINHTDCPSYTFSLFSLLEKLSQVFSAECRTAGWIFDWYTGLIYSLYKCFATHVINYCKILLYLNWNTLFFSLLEKHLKQSYQVPHTNHNCSGANVQSKTTSPFFVSCGSHF